MNYKNMFSAIIIMHSSLSIKPITTINIGLSLTKNIAFILKSILQHCMLVNQFEGKSFISIKLNSLLILVRILCLYRSHQY